MREKLIDLIVSADISLFGTDKPYAEVYADHLIANGVRLEEKQATSDETSKWISVKDRLPEDDEVVLIACKIGKIFVGYHKHLFQGCEVWRILTARDSTKKITYTVTHWMPLPQPPKGE